jgi:hypothetical protein
MRPGHNLWRGGSVDCGAFGARKFLKNPGFVASLRMTEVLADTE